MRRIYKVLTLVALSIFGSTAYSQTDGTYGDFSPYSMFGVGDMYKDGTAFNKSMGGVGIATRNKRFINYLNPAALTARDTLSFMADIGLIQSNKIYSQGDIRSASNVFNLSNIVISVPIYKSSALAIGVTPFSNIGYNFSFRETDPDIIGNTGNVAHEHYGKGSVYKAFLGAGATFWKKLSVGAEFIYYFGNIDKVYNVNYANSSIRSINSGSELLVRGATGKFGLQFEQNLGQDVSLTIGTTYKLGTNMGGETTHYEYANQSSITDTISYNVVKNKVKFADEFGVGLALKGGDKWSVEVDYLRSDWTNTGIDKTEGFSNSEYSLFNATASNSIRAGFEIVPNRNDIRYYLRRVAYRAGIYYDQEHYMFDGNKVNSAGITFGFTLPIYKWHNGLTLGVDIGQRGSSKNNMIKENYFNFSIGFNIHDIWFQKPKYD